MTVTYTAKVANSSFASFLRLLLRWRASIYKLLWKDFLVYALAFFSLSFIYRFALPEQHKRNFEKVARYCNEFNNLIPVAFVLGFYVTLVVGRWWDQFNLIPWPDRFAMFVTAHVHGHDERGRVMRRTMMRYLCLSYVITMSSICPPVKKRFNHFSKMTEAGFMVPGEQKIMEEMKTTYNKYFVPLAWCTALITRARKEGRIKDDFAVKTLIDEVNNFRGMLGGLFNYDWMSVPLVYTQVVTLAVYMFFLSCLMGRQFLEQDAPSPDMYFPLFTFLQFFFYMGWLKVAEVLVNPFGEDDDDFDVNMLIDRNLQVSYLVVDEMHADHPELIKDAYWETIDFELPYTSATENLRPSVPFLGSAMNIDIHPELAEFVPLASVAEEGMPTDIPGAKETRTTPHKRSFKRNISTASSIRANPLTLFKRGISRDSRDSVPPPVKRIDSSSSRESLGMPSSLATHRTQDEIFAMSDLEDPCEDELDHLLDKALAETEPDKQKQLLQQMAAKRAALHNSKLSLNADKKSGSTTKLKPETPVITPGTIKLGSSPRSVTSLPINIPARQPGSQPHTPSLDTSITLPEEDEEVEVEGEHNSLVQTPKV